MTKTHIVLLSAISIFAASPALAQTPLALQGGWSTPGSTARVRLGPCEHKPTRLCGVLVSVSDPHSVRPGLVGRVVLKDLVWRDGAWRGRITDLATAEVNRGSLRMSPAAQRGVCGGPPCQGQVWRRVTAD